MPCGRPRCVPVPLWYGQRGRARWVALLAPPPDVRNSAIGHDPCNASTHEVMLMKALVASYMLKCLSNLADCCTF